MPIGLVLYRYFVHCGKKKVSIFRLIKITWEEDYSVKGIDILSNKPNLQIKLIKNKYVELFCNMHFKKKVSTWLRPLKNDISRNFSFT